MFITPKPENRDYYLTLIVVDENDITKTKEYYPKTYSDAVYLGNKLFGKNMLDHINENTDMLHPTSEELNLLRKSPEEGGIIRLNEEGYIPTKYTNPIAIALYYDYPTVLELVNSSTFTLPDDYGRLVMVQDSFEDPRARNKHKWTLYRYIGPVPNNILSYQIIITEIDIDLVFTWEQFTDGMKAKIEEIDEAVRLKHYHDNLPILEKFTVDNNGDLNFDLIPITIRERFKSFILGKENEELYLLNGDMGMQITAVRYVDSTIKEEPTVDENHNTEPMIVVRGDCSDMFRSQTDLIKSPKLNTILMTKADHFFDGCINLESIDWYVFKNVTSANYFANECQSVKYFPDLDMKNVEEAEAFLASSGIKVFGDLNAPKLKSLVRFFSNCKNLTSINSINAPVSTSIASMFYNCVSLKELPEEINLESTTVTDTAFYNCISLEKIGKIKSPNMTSAIQMFANCTMLKSIEEIDFSNCTDTTNMFTNCTNLMHVGIKPGTLKTNISFFNTKLTSTSLRKILNNLPVVDNKTIVINYSEAAASLTNEEIANARIKGWTIQR